MDLVLNLHYDELRDRRVMYMDEIILGRSYLLCHVPVKMIYDMGTEPSCREEKILEVRYLSINDIQLSHFEKVVDPDAVARMKSSTLLNEKFWMFSTDNKANPEWHYCADWGMETSRPTVNYILDLQDLAEEGISVIRTPIGKYPKPDAPRPWEDSPLFEI